ncbi:hypothetical protein K2173_013547 [Erythroxylum novogranatense]|uniref:AB hydrolase-1 domain-containing protein n=1 Tax=Erythroxylum novogranatense TaxID=1862640 RepID=A0AAV8TLK2_9ROSI|nr:hypothetical protein K2173_013547 [Erythroxylum novogranatense]
MVNSLVAYTRLLHWLMKLVGMRQEEVHIEPGTVIHFWVPSETTSKANDLHTQPIKKKQNPEKPVVVFLHGFGFNGILNWQFQVLALSRKYSLYVPDFLFFGGSTTLRNDRSPGFQAESMAKALRQLGIHKCTLVGHSYGGMVGFKMAEMFPDLVHSMVICCSVMALTDSISRVSLARLGFSSWSEFLIPNSIIGVKAMLNGGSYRSQWIPEFVHKDILEVMFDNREERTELLEALQVRDEDFRISKFSQKIHLLWGKEDKIFTMEVAYNLKEQLEGKPTLDAIEKAGHLVQLDRPFVYNSCLKKILESFYNYDDLKQQ